MHTTTLKMLEAEAIHIIREAYSTADNAVLLYSIGKDSSVLTHLAHKAFYPNPIPFRLMHIDTGWKFVEMYVFKRYMELKYKLDILTHKNTDNPLSPLTSDSDTYTRVMKTDVLKKALTEHGFDVAFCGARRDEEMSRAKERVCSFRDKDHVWNPRHQRPEPWDLLNTQVTNGGSLRVFPLSNWTELNVWQYIYQEKLTIMPLYFAAPRPVVSMGGKLIMVNDTRLDLGGKVPTYDHVRFRTLGCYPLTAAILSNARDVSDIICELQTTQSSERSGRMIDEGTSMEHKKREGYF